MILSDFKVYVDNSGYPEGDCFQIVMYKHRNLRLPGSHPNDSYWRDGNYHLQIDSGTLIKFFNPFKLLTT